MVLVPGRAECLAKWKTGEGDDVALPDAIHFGKMEHPWQPLHTQGHGSFFAIELANYKPEANIAEWRGLV